MCGEAEGDRRRGTDRVNYPWRFDDDKKFDKHCLLLETARVLIRGGKFDAALLHLDDALKLGESPNAHWNRALALLALGRYQEGFKEYRNKLLLFPQWPEGERLRRDLPLWSGEPLNGRRVVLIHEAGYGDTIMLSRYIKVLHEKNIDVAVAVPDPLRHLIGQLAPIVGEVGERDVQCQFFDLMWILDQSIRTIPVQPYLEPEIELKKKWERITSLQDKKKVGIAWSSIRDANMWRSLELKQFLDCLDIPNAVFFSLQEHDSQLATKHGVWASKINNFADVAALASVMDMIVSVDTAALHVAGAIGHMNTYAVLPHVMCWRWQCDNPWYPNIKLCPQQKPDDWSSAFEQIDR
jgi:hypothetical protein